MTATSPVDSPVGQDTDAGPEPAPGDADATPSAQASPDVEALASCPGEQPCAAAGYAQLIEGFTHNIYVEGVDCVLEALAERRPGRYLHETEATFSNGGSGARHTLLVLEDGSVLYARAQHISCCGGTGQDVSQPAVQAGQRCTLKPTSYFESCREALAPTPSSAGRSQADEAVAWACAFGDGDSLEPSRLEWFESCTTESPIGCD